MFDHLYATLPEVLREQQATALRFSSGERERHG
jgi:hypothetical protein